MSVILENNQLNTAVLVLVYKKVESTQTVFDAIRHSKPKKLYIAANSAKNDAEVEKCQMTRQIFEEIDWDCEVKRLYRDEHLDLTTSVSSAIDWFFDNEDEGIILEDDCLPNKSFFCYCEEMLIKYRNNKDVMHIAGTNDFSSQSFGPDSYFFSGWPGIWGWATWKDTWSKYDLSMNSFDKFKKNNSIKQLYSDKDIQEWMMERFNFANSKYGNIWDYVYHYAIISNNGLCVTPSKNLIKNIGFTNDATHTIIEPESYKNVKLQSLDFPLHHPSEIVLNAKYVEMLYENLYKAVVKRKGIRKLTKYLPLYVKIQFINLRKFFGK